jgi:hypothetical protein
MNHPQRHYHQPRDRRIHFNKEILLKLMLLPKTISRSSIGKASIYLVKKGFNLIRSNPFSSKLMAPNTLDLGKLITKAIITSVIFSFYEH